MSNEIKIVSVSKDGGPVLIGRHFQVLEDRSLLTFNTKDIKSFLNFIGAVNEHRTDENPVDLYYTENRIVAVRRVPTHESLPVAVCELEESPLLGLVRNRVKAEADPDTFELFLYTMREFYSPEAHTLYNSIRNLTIKKITKVERRKDNQGNFCLAITRGKSENGEVIDVEPDITIGLSVPLFTMMPDKITLAFDVHMSYKEIEEGSIAIGYRLVSPLFEQIVEGQKRVAIMERLDGEPFTVLYGSAKINQLSDEWKYHSNGIQ